MITLNIETRDIAENLTTLRKKGLMPAVYYGKKEASTPIVLLQKDFIKAWNEAGESSVITLKRKDGEDLEALIYDVSLDPLTDIPRHADFYVFEKGKKLEVSVPLEFIGVSAAVKDLGGILVKVLHELKIEAMPKDLPSEVTVDISSLVNFDSQILARDVVLPAGVTLVEDPEEVVVLVNEAKVEVEAAPVDLASIEVVKKGKEVPAGEEGAAPAAADAGKAAPKAEKK